MGIGIVEASLRGVCGPSQRTRLLFQARWTIIRWERGVNPIWLTFQQVCFCCAIGTKVGRGLCAGHKGVRELQQPGLKWRRENQHIGWKWRQGGRQSGQENWEASPRYRAIRKRRLEVKGDYTHLAWSPPQEEIHLTGVVTCRVQIVVIDFFMWLR